MEESQHNRRKVFVVYGRNSAAREALFEFLRALDLDPIEWEDAVRMTKHGSPFIGNVLDTGFAEAQACVVLVTGDDVGRVGTRYLHTSDPPHEKSLTPQPRLNVVFESGMAFAIFPERTIVVRLGHTRDFTDLAGRHTIHFSDDFQSRQKLRDRLATAGCDVKTTGKSDWHTAGDFASAIVSPEIDASTPGASQQSELTSSQCPRISITPEDLMGGMTPTMGFVITNVGELELHKLRLNTVVAGEHDISFPENIPVIKQGASTPPIVPNVPSFGNLFIHDVVMAMRSDVDRQARGKMIDAAIFPATAEYEDWQGNRYKASWTYQFWTHVFRMQQMRTERSREVVPDTHGPYLTVSSVKTERL